MNKKILLSLLLLFGICSVSAFAGTGGEEVDAWYTQISEALQGTWGKIIAMAFLGLTIILFKNGSILGGIFMMMVGLGVGTIPGIVDSKYSAIMYVADSHNVMDKVYTLLNSYPLLGL